MNRLAMGLVVLLAGGVAGYVGAQLQGGGPAGRALDER